MQKVLGSLLFVLVTGAAATACTATGSARYSASATMPTMVYVSPGVQVIEDYDEPVFYSSNVYWRYNGGVWYQSRAYTGGWVRVSTPPAAIVRIQQPAMYVHYRASARGGAQANANPTPVQQQERREDKREIQQERREDKREDKQERREDKREDKQDRREDKQDRRDDKHDNHDNDHKGHKK